MIFGRMGDVVNQKTERDFVDRRNPDRARLHCKRNRGRLNTAYIVIQNSAGENRNCI